MSTDLLFQSNHELTRRDFGAVAAGVLAARAASARVPPKALAVVAHPDDEYHFAVTAYRMARELDRIVDQVVITNGEGGYRYSSLAEAYYGQRLTDEVVGRSRLPAIRKKETLAAGRILGIRRHYFLGQKDQGYTLDPSEALASWDQATVRTAIEERLRSEQYDVVFTLLPDAGTHGHHKAAALIVAEIVQSLPVRLRPALLGAEAASSAEPPRLFDALAGWACSRVAATSYEVLRTKPLGFRDALTHQIIANWVIAEHKSQGLFQTDAGRHDVERFRLFEISGPRGAETAAALFDALRT